MSLTSKQLKYLSRCTHVLKPVVMLGQNGLSDNVLAEIETALEHHELIKVKIRAGNRATRDQLIEEICQKTGAENIQRTGNVLSIYRQNRTRPVINLPS